MLAFSAVTQFPTNGSSTRWGGKGVQANTSAEDVMTVKRRDTRTAFPELGASRLPRQICSQVLTEAPLRPRLRRAWMPCQDKGCVRLPKSSPNHESVDMLGPVYHRVENYR